MRLWYLRRAIPWPPVTGCVAVAALLVAAVHRWPSMASLGLPLAALTVVAAACLLFDDPPVAVSAVTPRGRRWAPAQRSMFAALLLAAGIALFATIPADVAGDLSDWVLVLGALTAAALLAVLTRVRGQVPQPGASVASMVVLGGLTPLVVGLMLDWPSPYPAPPGLTDGLRAFWAGGAALATCGVLGLFVTRRT
jgi:hypothetical protein